jgi:hypothetical protein
MKVERKRVSWLGRLDLRALSRNPETFLQRKYPRAGRKEVGRGRKEGWDRPQLRTSSLWDWP